MLDVAQQQIRWQEEIIVGLEGDVDTLRAFCGKNGLVVPVLLGMSGEGIAVRMRTMDQAQGGGGVGEGGAVDDDEPDSESAEVASRDVVVEESKEPPPAVQSVYEPGRRVSQSDLSSLPTRLAALSSQLAEVMAERTRLQDALADKDEEMKEADELHRTEKELIALQLRELVSVVEEERRWRTEAEQVKLENELMRRKIEVIDKEHGVSTGELRDEVERLKDERRQLQAKLREAVLELQRQQETKPEEQYRPPVKPPTEAVKDDLAITTAQAAPAQEPLRRPSTSPAPTGTGPLLPTPPGVGGPMLLSPAAKPSASTPSSPGPAVSPVLLGRKHMRMKSQTLKKGDLSHPLSLLFPGSASHSRSDSIASLSSTLELLKDDSVRVSTLTSALSKKVDQYLKLKEAYCNSNDHIAMLEMALQDANARIKEVGEGQRGKIEALERKLAEAEAVCHRLLAIERSKRSSSGSRELREIREVVGGGGGHGGTIVVPVQAVVTVSGGKSRKPSSGPFGFFSH